MNEGVYLFDLYSWMKSNEDGFILDGVLFTYDFNRTGIFSADGINLNKRGQALLATGIIEYLNANFGSSMPIPNVNDYPGNEYVNGF